MEYHIPHKVPLASEQGEISRQSSKRKRRYGRTKHLSNPMVNLTATSNQEMQQSPLILGHSISDTSTNINLKIEPTDETMTDAFLFQKLEVNGQLVQIEDNQHPENTNGKLSLYKASTSEVNAYYCVPPKHEETIEEMYSYPGLRIKTEPQGMLPEEQPRPKQENTLERTYFYTDLTIKTEPECVLSEDSLSPKQENTWNKIFAYTDVTIKNESENTLPENLPAMHTSVKSNVTNSQVFKENIKLELPFDKQLLFKLKAVLQMDNPLPSYFCVAIIDKSHPNGKISKTDAGLLQQELIKALDNTLFTEQQPIIPPTFHDMIYADEVLRVYCVNDHSLMWLCKAVKNLSTKLWSYSELALVEISTLPDLYIKAVVFIPENVQELDVILQRLDVQNPWANVRDWCVFNYRATSNYSIHIVFGIKPQHHQALEDRNCKLFYGVTSINLKLFLQ